MLVQVSHWTRFALEAMSVRRFAAEGASQKINEQERGGRNKRTRQSRIFVPPVAVYAQTHLVHTIRTYKEDGHDTVPKLFQMSAISWRFLDDFFFTLPQPRRYPRQWSNDDKNKKTNSYPVLERCSVRPEEESNGGERDFIRVEGNWNL